MFCVFIVKIYHNPSLPFGKIKNTKSLMFKYAICFNHKETTNHDL